MWQGKNIRHWIIYYNSVRTVARPFTCSVHMENSLTPREGSKKRLELSDDACSAVYNEVLTLSQDIKLPRVTCAKMAEKYNVSNKTIRRIWDKRHVGSTPEDTVHAIRSKRTGKRGINRIANAAVSSKLEQVPLRLQQTSRHAQEMLPLHCGKLISVEESDESLIAWNLFSIAERSWSD